MFRVVYSEYVSVVKASFAGREAMMLLLWLQATGTVRLHA